MIDVETVDKIANLARLEMNAKQKENAAKSLADILDYVEELSKVDTSGVKPAVFAADRQDVLRDDAAAEEFSQETALQNAPSAKKGHFAVAKVLG